MKLSKDNRGIAHLAVFIVFAVAVLGFVGYTAWNAWQTNKKQDATQVYQSTKKAEEKHEKPELTLLAGNFGDNGEYGTFQAKGYTTKIRKDEAFCESNCKQYDYIFFNITETKNVNIFEFLKDHDGNAYVRDKAIGIGCLINDQIAYYNTSDAKGSQQYKLSKDDTGKIMDATSAKPVVLELEKLKFSSGRGGSTCTSLFTSFKIVSD